MRLAVVISLLLFGFAFAQQSHVSLEACGDGQIISQSADADKAEVKFTSSDSMAVCFSSLNQQMVSAGWERSIGGNNVYTSSFYRITYTQGGAEQMLIVLKINEGYKVIIDL